MHKMGQMCVINSQYRAHLQGFSAPAAAYASPARLRYAAVPPDRLDPALEPVYSESWSLSRGVMGGVEKCEKESSLLPPLTVDTDPCSAGFSKSVPRKISPTGWGPPRRSFSAASFWMRATVSSSCACVHSGARSRSHSGTCRKRAT